MTEQTRPFRSAYPVVYRNGSDCYLCAKCKSSYILTTAPAQNDVALCADCVAWWRESGEGITEVRTMANGPSNAEERPPQTGSLRRAHE